MGELGQQDVPVDWRPSYTRGFHIVWPGWPSLVVRKTVYAEPEWEAKR
jgi:hypothetical protein